MTITILNFKKLAGCAVVCGGLLALSVGTLQAQAPAAPAAVCGACTRACPRSRQVHTDHSADGISECKREG